VRLSKKNLTNEWLSKRFVFYFLRFIFISFDFSDFSFWVLILQTVRCIPAINCQTAWQHTPYLKYLFFLVRRFMSLSVFMNTYYLSFCIPINVFLSLLIFITFLVSHSYYECLLSISTLLITFALVFISLFLTDCFCNSLGMIFLSVCLFILFLFVSIYSLFVF